MHSQKLQGVSHSFNIKHLGQPGRAADPGDTRVVGGQCHSRGQMAKVKQQSSQTSGLTADPHLPCPPTEMDPGLCPRLGDKDGKKLPSPWGSEASTVSRRKTIEYNVLPAALLGPLGECKPSDLHKAPDSQFLS